MSRFKNWKAPRFDAMGNAYPSSDTTMIGILNSYGWRCQHYGNLKLGIGVDIGCFSYLNAKYGIKLGDNVQVGSHCSLYTESTIDGNIGEIDIGENSCIGTHSTIMPNVKIGKNSIIAAHSFVKSGSVIPSFELWLGIPAKKQKRINHG